jgi:S-adenosylmethionine decarboxylase
MSERNEYLGKHVLLDIWNCEAGSLTIMRSASYVLRHAAELSGATVLNDSWHHFGDGHGYTGVVILAESHISIHTWPEKNFAAIDIFYCGNCDPNKSIPYILDMFKPTKYNIEIYTRG